MLTDIHAYILTDMTVVLMFYNGVGKNEIKRKILGYFCLGI